MKKNFNIAEMNNWIAGNATIIIMPLRKLILALMVKIKCD